MPRLLLPRLAAWALAAAVCSAAVAETNVDFQSFSSCASCVAAGFGWSVARSKCGHFKNKQCPSTPARDQRFAAIWTAIDAAAASCASTPACTTARECYGARIEHDLAPWRNAGGVSREAFQRTAAERFKTGMGLSHYQIVGGRLYRDERCMFSARCRGVEYFLHWLLAEDAAGITPSERMLPDMEWLLNTRDYPQIHRHALTASTAPIFSFSVDGNYVDVMYPAWTFWCGGPAIKLFPRGLGRWDQKRTSVLEAAASTPWQQRKNICFFRGARTTEARDAVIFFGDRYPQLLDAEYTANYKRVSGLEGVLPVEEVPLEEHCSYRFLLNARGVAASFRYKHLFLCGSAVFNVGELTPPPPFSFLFDEVYY
jgi:protein glucosyltransferase